MELYHLYYPALSVRCCTYIRKNSKLEPRISLTTNNSFLVTTINLNQQFIKIYNIYSPGRRSPVVDLLRHLITDRNLLVMRYFNAHHEQWYLPLAASFLECMRSERIDTDTICNWLAKHSFTLQNTPGTDTHFS